MRTYVEELKKVRQNERTQESHKRKGPFPTFMLQIIETMSMTSDVASFTNLIGTFYEFVPEGQEEEGNVGEKEPDFNTIMKDINSLGNEVLDESTSDSGIEARSKDVSEVANALGRYVGEEEDDDEELAAEGKRLASELTSLRQDMRDLQQLRREISKEQPQEWAGSGVPRVGQSRWPETDESSEDDELFQDPVGQDLSEGNPISLSTPTRGTLKNAVASLERDMEGIRERLSNLERVC